MERRRLITILVPIYNEETVLPIFHERVEQLIDSQKDYDWEIVAVNDGSTDISLEMIREYHRLDPRWRYVNLSRNFGKEIAMLAGMDHSHGDAVVLIDADLQDPPELIPQMIRYWEEGYDDVYARRLDRGRESWLRRRLTLTYYSMLAKMTSTPVLQNTGDFRLLSRKMVNALCQMRETQRYTKGLFSWAGFRKKEITFDRGDRAAGKSKWSLTKLMGLATEGITSSSTRPLKLATFLGLTISIIAFAYIVWIIFKTIYFGERVRGFPTIMVTILFLGGIQLLTIGIIGEYVGRIFNETKQRPPYFVDETSDDATR